jgi:hypothetical protein
MVAKMMDLGMMGILHRTVQARLTWNSDEAIDGGAFGDSLDIVVEEQDQGSVE